MVTSRERIKMIMDHKEPDRIGIDLGSNRSSSISAIAYNKLRNKLGVSNGIPRMYDFIMQLAYPEKKIMDILKSGGGFVFNPTHNILADVPADNIIAMFEAAYEYGFYR